MELKEIQNLIKFVAKTGVSEVQLELGDVKLTIKTQDGVVQQVVSTPVVEAAPVAAPIPVAAPAPVAPAAAAPQDTDEGLITIKSPIIGTFYRRPSPDKPNFVEVGTEVKEGDVLCVVEAMKLFNEIESEISGTIVKVLVEDASPVEFDQPLFVIDPS
ncbi:MAG: acetyl-CoA carboxylase biotin carboxyl carrier protein [Flavobacteriaceae bacterium]